MFKKTALCFIFIATVLTLWGMMGTPQPALATSLFASPLLNNNHFAKAAVIQAIPYSRSADFSTATLEAGEPLPTCMFPTGADRTRWFAYTPTASGWIFAQAQANVPLALATYTGDRLTNLTPQACGYNYGFASNALLLNAGVTYYFQVDDLYGQAGQVNFSLGQLPVLNANFGYYPYNPSKYTNVEFYNSTSDPVSIATTAWNFGDGTTGTGNQLQHRFPADGSYTVSMTTSTADGRTATTSQTVTVATYDVAITKVTWPVAGRENRTRDITIGLHNKGADKTVRVELYKSTTNGYGGYESVGVLTLLVPTHAGKQTTPFKFSYTFTGADAAIGKVTLRAEATMVDYPDALPADNVAISLPIRVRSALVAASSDSAAEAVAEAEEFTNELEVELAPVNSPEEVRYAAEESAALRTIFLPFINN